jgi:hypothetical protein
MLRQSPFRRHKLFPKTEGTAMSDDKHNRLKFDLTLTASFAAINALVGALQLAIELAVFPERVEVKDDSPRARLEALAKQILREAKSMTTEGMAETDEAAGTRVAIALVQEISNRLSGEM